MKIFAHSIPVFPRAFPSVGTHYKLLLFRVLGRVYSLGKQARGLQTSLWLINFISPVVATGVYTNKHEKP